MKEHIPKHRVMKVIHTAAPVPGSGIQLCVLKSSKEESRGADRRPSGPRAFVAVSGVGPFEARNVPFSKKGGLEGKAGHPYDLCSRVSVCLRCWSRLGLVGPITTPPLPSLSHGEEGLWSCSRFCFSSGGILDPLLEHCWHGE